MQTPTYRVYNIISHDGDGFLWTSDINVLFPSPHVFEDKVWHKKWGGGGIHEQIWYLKIASNKIIQVWQGFDNYLCMSPAH
jgi:hypothetical protein